MLNETRHNHVLVSYVIPVRDEFKFAQLCLASVFNQSLPERIEVLLIDNNPQPQLQHLSKTWSISYFHEPLKGPSAARNRGFREARGKFIVYLDSDVVLNSDWTRVCLQQLRASWVDCVQTPVIPASLRPMSLMRWWRSQYISEKTQGTFNYLNCALRSLPLVNSSAFMIRRSHLTQKEVLFDEKLERCEDLDFSYQLMFRGSHFAFVSSSHALVYDHRNFFEYLQRSFRIGRAAVKVRRLWFGSPINPVALFCQLAFDYWVWEPSACFFIKCNQVFDIMGELKEHLTPVTEKKDPQIFSHTRADARNQFLLKIKNRSEKEMYLSPFVRIIDLSTSLVLFNVRTRGRFLLDSTQRRMFLTWIERSAQSIVSSTADLSETSFLGHLEEQEILLS